MNRAPLSCVCAGSVTAAAFSYLRGNRNAPEFSQSPPGERYVPFGFLSAYPTLSALFRQAGNLRTSFDPISSSSFSAACCCSSLALSAGSHFGCCLSTRPDLPFVLNRLVLRPLKGVQALCDEGVGLNCDAAVGGGGRHKTVVGRSCSSSSSCPSSSSSSCCPSSSSSSCCPSSSSLDRPLLLPRQPLSSSSSSLSSVVGQCAEALASAETSPKCFPKPTLGAVAECRATEPTADTDNPLSANVTPHTDRLCSEDRQKWYAQHKDYMRLGQFAANDPIEDRASLDRIATARCKPVSAVLSVPREPRRGAKGGGRARQEGRGRGRGKEEGEEEEEQHDTAQRSPVARKSTENDDEEATAGGENAVPERIKRFEGVVMAAVYDGHGGWQIADFVQRKLPGYVEEALQSLPVVSEPSTTASSSKFSFSPPVLTSLLPRQPGPSSAAVLRGIGGTLSSDSQAPAAKGTASLPRLDEVSESIRLSQCNPPPSSSSSIGPQLCQFDAVALSEAIKHAFIKLDEDILKSLHGVYTMGFPGSVKMGACCVAVLADDSRIVVANVGDCKAVLCRRGQALPLSRQQNADNLEERERLRREHPGETDVVICKRTWSQPREPSRLWEYPLYFAGVHLGAEQLSGSCYVKGRLQPTRSFGDFYLKDLDYAYDTSRKRHFIKQPHSFPYISANPEVDVFQREDGDEFVVMGSDGLWDYLTDDEVVEIVRKALPISVEAAVQKVLDTVLQRAATECGLDVTEMSVRDPKERRRYYDDTTVVVLKF